jgi:hypothetical protein
MDSDYGFVRSNDTQVPGVFALLLPSSRDLRFLAAAACKLQNVGHKISVLLFREISGSEVRSDIPLNSESQFITSGRCRLYYDVISMANMQRADGIARHWLGSLAIWPDVVLTVTEKDALPDDVGLHLEERDVLNVTLIRIPRADLPYTSWMGSLSTEEWRSEQVYPRCLLLTKNTMTDWNVPHVDVSIITKNRPRSLARLMSSLASARYFGDALNLRVNLEQSSDAETLRMAEGFEWDHGSVYLHHRVVHGGLLPAVVESWYPHSNHNYGLLLEDDVELSPLFYAWVKMSILRYRYSTSTFLLVYY